MGNDNHRGVGKALLDSGGNLGVHPTARQWINHKTLSRASDSLEIDR